MKSQTIDEYNQTLAKEFSAIANRLKNLIDTSLLDTENKLWHGHPVWFINSNPIVGYSLQKKGVRLMFWSGADFEEPKLQPGTGKFKDASVFYNSVDEISPNDIKNWCQKAIGIQYNYRDIIKNKGQLERIN
ncbi:DUF1801 domain-containing protein [Patescibacteria group bacterium]|nr:MAG: DUF1801 domain-containing protein [Patescibacteria group bacterium]